MYLRRIIQRLQSVAPPVLDKQKPHDGRVNPVDAKVRFIRF
jgi:hypothetical protein